MKWGRGPTLLFCTWLSICPNTIYWWDCSFPPKWSGHSCQKSIDHRYLGLFLDTFDSSPWVYMCIIIEKAMAPHSSTLAWKIPWMEEPGGLQSMGSLRVRWDSATSLSLFSFMHWRRKWQPTPVFLPGESQGQGSLMGCRLWGHTESDTTEAT